MLKRFPRRRWLPALVLLLLLGLANALWFAQGTPPPTQRAPAETYQDFRNGRPLLPSFRLIGRDADKVTKADDEGLRITLPPNRKIHDAVGVATSFSLSGDFVITATYELLSASRPSKGYGTGVSLGVANDLQRTKFAKVGRFQRVTEGSVYAAEFWNNNPPPDKDWQFNSEPTEAHSGQLRLVREDSTIHFLVADGPENKFRQIDERQFGTDDLALVLLEVVDSGTEGNSVDARLVELKIRSGRLLPDERSAETLPSEQEHPAHSKSWLIAAVLVALLITVALSASLGLWLYVRQHRKTETRQPLENSGSANVATGAVAFVSFPCASCGKTLKVRAHLAGKRGKCPDCGKVVLVPGS